MRLRGDGKGRAVAALLLGAASLWAGTPRLSTRGGSSARADRPAAQPAAVRSVPDDAAARAAFLAAAPVFTHPRCQNCHPAGDAPLQGDDSHPHAQNVKRGPHGMGKYGMKCGACHQLANLPGANMPPGAPSWRLPPPITPMVFVGKTAGQLCGQLKDASQNGGKTIDQIIEHVTSDTFVLWGWNPGEGRTTPLLGHAEFAALMNQWASNGAACPETAGNP
jgi:cytochrome c5